MRPLSGGWAGPDGLPKRTHPLTVAAAAVPLLIGAVFFVLATTGTIASTATTSSRSTSSSDPGSPIVLFLFAAVLVGTGGVQILKWFVTTYTVLPTELVVDEGVLSREHRVLPFARVQQADTHQNLVGQVLGLTELRIDCAGAAGSTQVKLRLLDAQTAQLLRDYVLLRRAELHAREAAAHEAVLHENAPRDAARPDARPPAGPRLPGPPGTWGLAGMGGAARGPITSGPGPPERTVVVLGPGRLALGAITHSSLVVGAPVVAICALWVGAVAALDSGTRTTGVAVFAIVPLVTLFLAFIAFAQLMQAVVGQYGFTVSIAGDDIHLRFGLFETRNLTVPRRRVQQITIADNPLRRACGLVELHLHTAASPGAKAQATTRFSIPVVRRADVDNLVTSLMGDRSWAIPAIEPRPPVAERRAIVRRTLLLLVAMGVPAVLLRPTGVALLIGVVLGVPWGRAAHRRAGHGMSGTVAAVTHGVLHHRIDLVPVGRVQSCRTERNPMQRLSNVTTFRIDVAGSVMSPFLWDMDSTVASQLRRELPRLSAP